MELDEYSKAALRTESVVDSISGLSTPSFYSALTAIVAIGSILDKMKKHIFYGCDINSDMVREDIEKAIESLEDLRYDINHNDLTDETKAEMFENHHGFYSEIGPEQISRVNTRILHVVLGILTEGAEMAEILTENIEGKPIDMVNLSEEIGDLNWYANGIFPDVSGVHYKSYLSNNIAKLAVRYPEKFTSWLADEKNRNLVKERKTLESNVK